MNRQIKRVFTTLLMSTMCLFAVAQKTIHGTVKDASGEPLIGVTVSVDGKSGTATDIDGKFTLNNVPESATLKVSYISYVTQTIPVAGKTEFNIVMVEDANELDEVVVVGYGTVKKTDLTGSVASVNTKDLTVRGAPSVMENLQGATPGVNITQSSGRVGGGFDIEIRGKSSINSSTKPLYVVDGVMCDDIDWLNQQDIERIDILKDASSTAIYGSRATAGVVMVTTKGGTTVKQGSKAVISYDGFYGVNKAARMPDFMDGQEFYNYRFMKFLILGPSSTTMNNAGRPAYVEEKIDQALLLGDDGMFVMKKMLQNGDTYDWPGIITKTGSQQNHYFSVSGSNDKVNYHMGVGYNAVKGLFQDDMQRRINLKGSLDAQVNRVVKVGFNFNMARQTNTYANGSAVSDSYAMNPFMVPYYLQDQYDQDGTWHTVGDLTNFPGNKFTLGTSNSSGQQFTDTFNPLMQVNNSREQQEAWRLLGNMYLQLDFMEGFNFKTTFSPNYSNTRHGYYSGIEDPKNPGHTYTVTKEAPYKQMPMDESHTWASAYYENGRSFEWTWDNILNWQRTFKIHTIGVMGLFSLRSYNTESIHWEGTNGEDNNGYHAPVMGADWYAMQNMAFNYANSKTSYSENSMVSYAFRVNYELLNRYLITATVRGDASSKFAAGNRWGTFPSAAVAWRLSEEDFMQGLDNVNNLKIRLSYGVTGNNAGVGNYATQTTASMNGSYPGMTGAYKPSGFVDAGLQWEKSHEFNAGIDFAFAKNRLSGSVDWYTKKSTDLLYNVSLPLEAGSGVSLTTNVGSVKNTGVEVALSAVLVDRKDWNWTVSLNFAHNKNEVLEINGIGDRYLNGSGKNLATNSLFVGESYSVLYAYKYDGVVSDRLMTVPDNEAAAKNGFTPGDKVREYDYYYKVYGATEGQPKIADTNGDGQIDDSDKQFFRGDPKFTGTLTSNLTWRGWDFGFQFYSKLGQYVYSDMLKKYWDYGDRGRQHIAADFYIPAGTLVDCDGLNPDGTFINPVYQERTHYGELPFPSNGSNGGLGNYESQFEEANSIQNASFVKVKYITLGYTFPKKWLSPWRCSNLRLYFTVTNPFVITSYKGFDPEWAGAGLSQDGPSTITYQVGASIQF